MARLFLSFPAGHASATAGAAQRRDEHGGNAEGGNAERENMGSAGEGNLSFRSRVALPGQVE